MTTREMREKRGQLAKDMGELTKKTPMSAEDRTKFDAIDAKQEQLRKDIEAIERAESLDAELRTNPPRQEAQIQTTNADPEVAKAKAEKRYQQAYWNYMRQGMTPDQYGFRGISEDDKKVLMRARYQLPTDVVADANKQAEEMRTTLSGTEVSGGEAAYPGATSGFFIPMGFENRIEEALKWYGGMMGGGPGDPEIYETATGQPLPFPTDNDTTVSGELVAENTQVTTQGMSWSQIIFGAFKFSTKLVPISIELLQDSAFDLESYTAKKFGIRLGRILNNKFTVGVGTTEPTGIITAATAGVTATGDDNQTTPDKTTQVGYNDLISLEHSVDRAYRNGAKWMFSDSTLASLKKLRDKNGRQLWQPGLSASMGGTALDTIDGYPYIVNNDMDSVGQTSPISARKTVLFGDLSKYLIRRVKNLAILRLSERFAEFGVVAFLGFARYDGNLLDAGTHPVKFITNAAS